MNKPVLLLIFNRLDTTKKVLSAIQEAKPPRLYIASDGPRENIENENRIVMEVREYVLNNIDWKCKVHTLFRENNLGCGRGVSSAITWFFSKEEDGIILEDDCLPNHTFFNYCEQLLDYYKSNIDIWHISGNQFVPNFDISASYYFSKIEHCWGWATWSNRWINYEYNLSNYQNCIVNKFSNNINVKKYWLDILSKMKNGEIDTWDYQWVFAIIKNKGLCINPTLNLVTNIGFGNNSTHTSDENNPLANLPTYSLGKIVHPKNIKVNIKAVNYIYENIYGIKMTESRLVHVKTIIKSLLKKVKHLFTKIILKLIPQIHQIENGVVQINGELNKLNKEVDSIKLMSGSILSNLNLSRKKEILQDIHKAEFKIFSQWGDDGIIQFLINQISIDSKTFIEFGVENYNEANTRFLLIHDNWKGLVIDGNASNIEYIKHTDIYWKNNLTAVHAFLTAENIREIIFNSGFCFDVGLLHIDIDGNDYWIWKAIDFIKPEIVIMEYNSVFGIEKSWTIPYDAKFYRTNAHYSNLYFGSSLLSLCDLASKKGYYFIGCNSAGNNAYFIRKDKINEIKAITPTEGYIYSQFRESRNEKGLLNYASEKSRLNILDGLPIFNTRSNKIERIKS